MMEHNTILYLSDRANSSPSLLVALKEKGYEVVTTDSPIEGVALLYVMHSVAAVVLDQDARERAGFDLAHSLRQIRPCVPVIVLCGHQIDSSMERTDTCVRKDKLASALKIFVDYRACRLIAPDVLSPEIFGFEPRNERKISSDCSQPPEAYE